MNRRLSEDRRPVRPVTYKEMLGITGQNANQDRKEVLTYTQPISTNEKV